MNQHRLLRSLSRTSSCDSNTAIIPSDHISSTSFVFDPNPATTNDNKPLVSASGCGFGLFRSHLSISTFIRSILNTIPIPTIRWLALPAQLSLTPSPGRKVTGTLFGNRRGHVSFAVQYDPRSEPILVVELAVSTAGLVKEMSSGLVRIALECEKLHHAAQSAARGKRGPRGNRKLFEEPRWSMYCNGRRCGYALSRECTEFDWHVLSTVQTVSVGAGVIPLVEEGGKKEGEGEGEVVYMRARFERVVGSRDSEAFYMMNPDGSGGPELSVFLLRI